MIGGDPAAVAKYAVRHLVEVLDGLRTWEAKT